MNILFGIIVGVIVFVIIYKIQKLNEKIDDLDKACVSIFKDLEEIKEKVK